MQKETKKLIRKINQGAGVIDIYLVTLAVNPANSLEIISANYLLQKPIRRNCPMIVGLCSGYYEAVELVEQIAEEVYEETGAMDIRGWLLEKAAREKKETDRWEDDADTYNFGYTKNNRNSAAGAIVSASSPSAVAGLCTGALLRKRFPGGGKVRGKSEGFLAVPSDLCHSQIRFRDGRVTAFHPFLGIPVDVVLKKSLPGGRNDRRKT
ncbi:hypothetical protein LC724_04255 [Blautia sp. RD014234]|nr:hypothetical protein [Blautia parvula]